MWPVALLAIGCALAACGPDVDVAIGSSESASGSGASGGAGGAGGAGGSGGACGDAWSCHVLWEEAFSGSGDVILAGVAADPKGNVVLSGTFAGTVDFGAGALVAASDRDLFVLELDPAGNTIWSKGFAVDAPPDTAGGPTGLAVDGEGNVVLTGLLLGAIDFGEGPLASASGSVPDVFVAKLDPGGDVMWSLRLPQPNADSPGGPRVATDAGDGVILLESFKGTVELPDGPMTSEGELDTLVAKLAPSGSYLWGKRLGGPGTTFYGLALATTGTELIMSGNLDGAVDLGGVPLAGAAGTLFAAALDGNGAPLWGRAFPAAPGSLPLLIPSGIAPRPGGGMLLTGAYSGSPDLGSGPLPAPPDHAMFALALDGAGQPLWSKGFIGATSRRITADAAGNIVATGLFRDTVDFGGGPLTSAGDADAFVIKLAPGGEVLWSARHGDARFELGVGAVDGDAHVLVAGNAWAVLPDGAADPSSPIALFVAMLSP